MWLITALGESWLARQGVQEVRLAALGQGCGLQVLVLTGDVFSRAPKASVQRVEASAPAAWTCPPTAPCSPPTDLPAGAPCIWPLCCWRTTALRCTGQHPAPSPPQLLFFPHHWLLCHCLPIQPGAPRWAYGGREALASLGIAARTHAPLLHTQGRQLRWQHPRHQSHTLAR